MLSQGRDVAVKRWDIKAHLKFAGWKYIRAKLFCTNVLTILSFLEHPLLKLLARPPYSKGVDVSSIYYG